MAFSYGFKWLALLLAAASLITTALADQALINSICAISCNHTQCLQVLQHKPNADRRGLGEYSTDLAIRRVQKSISLAKKFAETATNIREKTEYEGCLELYQSSLHKLKECKKFFSVNDFENALDNASGALTDITTCDTDCESLGFSLAPLLKAANLESGRYSQIVLAVAHVGPM